MARACLTTFASASDTKKYRLASMGSGRRRSSRFATTVTGIGSRDASDVDRRAEPLVGQDAGMDARGEVAQVGEPLSGLLDGGGAELGRGGPGPSRCALGHLHRQQGADELLLRAVVQVARDLGARGVGGLDDAPRAALSSAARAAATSRSRAASSAAQMLLDVGRTRSPRRGRRAARTAR